MSAVPQKQTMLPGLISLLLVIALGISLAKLMWLVITPAPTANTQNQDEAVAVIVEKKQADYGKLISDQHIFGVFKKKEIAKPVAPVAEPTEKEVVRTKLNLKLHGIVAYKSKKGFALISSDNGPQKVYGEGESIQEGVTVSDILPDKVVLDNRGIAEELLLPVDKKNVQYSGRSSSSSNNPNLPGNETQKRSQNTLPTNADNVPELGIFRQQVISNPSKLMEIVRPAPAIVNGQFVGFRIQPGKKRKLFRQLNFRPNDIITEINGILLDDASKGAMVLGELAQASNVSVKVKRGDKEVFIEHTF